MVSVLLKPVIFNKKICSKKIIIKWQDKAKYIKKNK